MHQQPSSGVAEAKRSAERLRRAQKELSDAVGVAKWQAQRRAARQEGEQRIVALRRELARQEARLDDAQARHCCICQIQWCLERRERLSLLRLSLVAGAHGCRRKRPMRL